MIHFQNNKMKMNIRSTDAITRMLNQFSQMHPTSHIKYFTKKDKQIKNIIKRYFIQEVNWDEKVDAPLHVHYPVAPAL